MRAEQDHNLAELLQRGSVWRGQESAVAGEQMLASGISGLDARIGGGWPRTGLIEILSPGIAGLSLLVPVLARLSAEPGWQSWINPPYIPYAPALLARGINADRVLLVREVDNDQALWAGEQALRSGTSTVVLLWVKRITTAQTRRLQLAAETGATLGVLFRSARDVQQSSVAGLRLQVSTEADALQVRVLKRRSGWAGGSLRVQR